MVKSWFIEIGTYNVTEYCRDSFLCDVKSWYGQKYPIAIIEKMTCKIIKFCHSNFSLSQNVSSLLLKSFHSNWKDVLFKNAKL